MVQSTVSHLLNSAATALGNVADYVGSGPYAVIRVALFCWSTSFILSSPSLFAWSWVHILEHSRAGDYLALCANPLSRDLHEPIVAYRILLPLLAHLLHLPALAALALPYVANLVFIGILYRASRRFIDHRLSLTATLLVSLSFAVFWTNWQPGFTDSATHALAASLLLSTSPVWTVIAVFLGLLNDERMLLPLPLLLLWHLYPPRSTVAVVSNSIRYWCLAAMGGILAYAILRHALTVGLIGPGIAKPAVYGEFSSMLAELRPKLGSWWVWTANAFMGFRWTWFLLVWAPFVSWRRGNWFAATGYSIALAVGTLSSAIVQDVGRSVGFLFPAVLLALRILADADRRWLTTRLRWLIVGLIVTPVFFTFDEGRPHWMRPLPFVLARIYTQ